MKHTRAIAGAAIAASVVVGGVTAVQTGQAMAARPSSISHVAKAPSTGLALFDGIYFDQGPVAKKLQTSHYFSTERKYYARSNTPRSIAAAKRVTDTISAKDPNFFNSFERGIHSGNPYEVKNALQHANVALAHAGVQTESSKTVKPDCGVYGVIAAAVFHVVAAVTAGGVAVVWLAVVGQVIVKGQNWFWSPVRANSAPHSAGAELNYDNAIAQITTTFQHA